MLGPRMLGGMTQAFFLRRRNAETNIGQIAYFFITVGIPTSLPILVYLWLFACSMLRHPTLAHFKTLLFLWQTQVGAVFAVVAALIGAAVILYQTASDRQMEEVRRERRAVALNASLPLFLMELSAYATTCAKHHASLLPQPTATPIRAPGLFFPVPPTGLIQQITDLIETNNPAQTRPLIVLIRQLQIHHARALVTQRFANNEEGHLLSRISVVRRIVDAAELFARSEKLLAYARGDGDLPATSVPPDDVRAAISLMLNCPPLIDEIEEEISRKSASNNSGAGWQKP